MKIAISCLTWADFKVRYPHSGLRCWYFGHWMIRSKYETDKIVCKRCLYIRTEPSHKPDKE